MRALRGLVDGRTRRSKSVCANAGHPSFAAACPLNKTRLMRGAVRGSIQRLTGFKAHGDLAVPAEVDDFLETGTTRAFHDQNALKRPSGAKGFADGMDSCDQGH